MNPERLKQIKEAVEWDKAEALEILAGDRDNYDGADGARYVVSLCGIIEELIAELEGQTHTPEQLIEMFLTFNSF